MSFETKTDNEILADLKAKFPDDVVKRREGPKKKDHTGKFVTQWFSYVPTDNLSERLDEVLGFNWSWEILDHCISTYTKMVSVEDGVWANSGKPKYKRVPKESAMVAVRGRLKIFLPSGREIVRDAYGGCEMNYGSQAGDSFKIADSNAFKKACIKLGLCRYFALEGHMESDDEPAPTFDDYRGNENRNTGRQGNSNKSSSKPNPFL